MKATFDSGWNEVLYVKIDDRVQEYGCRYIFWAQCGNVVSRPQTPNWHNFLRFQNFIESNFWFWIKQGLMCKNWCYGSRVYGLIHLLGLSGPNIVYRAQNPKSRNFLRNHGFSGFILRFWKKWGPVRENWSYGSGLTAWYVFCQRIWAQIALN